MLIDKLSIQLLLIIFAKINYNLCYFFFYSICGMEPIDPYISQNFADHHTESKNFIRTEILPR